jgi:non-canonical (house-cleaning) NTP pyrophosphatase
MKLVLGSTSAVKIKALEAALAAFGASVELVPVKASSGAPEQPMGAETSQGAKNRMASAQQLCPDGDFFIAIENGIFFENGQWLDRAVVTCQSADQKNFFIAYSDGVQFPAQAVETARQRGFQEWTVGKIMMEMGIVQQHDDPHLELSGKSRALYLEEAIVDIFNQMRGENLI